MTDIVPTVFAVTGLLALISLLLPIADRLAIPYSVLLAVVGCAIGAATEFSGPLGGSGIIGDMLGALQHFELPAEALLYIFLPALLFETALNVDVEQLTREVAPVLLLAVIGVLVSTGIVGFALWGAFGEGMLACLLLGAVVATTDPVAVVAVFRDIGAPRRLMTLVEGEALFNDAAAIALYGLLLTMIIGTGDARPFDTLLEFVRDFVGGLAIGYAAGWGGGILLSSLRDHRLAEVTLTMALAYLIFVVGQRYLHVSGVVAVVAAGLVINRRGRRRLWPSTWQLLLRTWEQIGFWATSLIFILAAMMVPSMLAGARPFQLVELAVLILAAFLARGVTLYGLLPALTSLRLAERVRNDHKLVILWGGMRGAVSLALAVAATQDTRLPEETRQLVGVLASGFILFTLIVGAPTLRPLMRILRLDKLSPADLALRNRVITLSLSEVGSDVEKLAQEHGIAGAPLDDVRRHYQKYRDGAAQIAEENAQLALEPRLRASLRILVEREEKLYLRHFEARTMSRRALGRLTARVALLRDAVKSGALAEYREAAAAIVGFAWSFRYRLAAQRYLSIAQPLARHLTDRFEAQLTARTVVRELQAFNRTQLRALFGDAPSGKIDATLAERLDLLNQAIDAVRLQYPTFARALQAQFLTLRALSIEEEQYRRLSAEAVLTREVFNDLMRALRRRRRAVEERPQLDLGLDRATLLAQVPLFANLAQPERRRISRKLRPGLAVPGETIVRKGERGDAMYFISSGAVEVRGTGDPVRLGSGDFFGELALLHSRPRNADVVALGYCNVLRLSSRDFERLLSADTALRAAIEATAAQRLETTAAQ